MTATVHSLHDDGVGIVGGGLLGLAAGYDARQARHPRDGLRGRRARRRPRGHDAHRRRRGRPLLPRGHPRGPPDARAGGRARPRGADPLAPARRRLLPRGPARVHVDASRGARASPGSRWSTRRAWPPSWPAASSPATLRRSTRSRSGHGSAGPRASGCGSQLFRPLLDSKFDGDYDDLPATYLWSRTRRTAGTRDKSGREVMGWIRGGHQVLADRLAEEIERLGGRVRTGTPVRHISSREGRATGVITDDGSVAHDIVVEHHAAAARRAHDRPGHHGAAARGPVPLHGHRLRRRPRAPQRQPLLRAEHHGPPDPDHERGRDHARRRPRRTWRGTCSTSPTTSRRTRRSCSRRRRTSPRPILGHVAAMFPGFDPERDVIASQVARARGSPSRSTGTAATRASPTSSPRPGWPWPPRRTSTPTSSTDRPSSASQRASRTAWRHGTAPPHHTRPLQRSAA